MRRLFRTLSGTHVTSSLKNFSYFLHKNMEGLLTKGDSVTAFVLYKNFLKDLPLTCLWVIDIGAVLFLKKNRVLAFVGI